jgi:hypothetical protein
MMKSIRFFLMSFVDCEKRSKFGVKVFGRKL